MELTEQQRQSVKEWLAAGASLADVQGNLKSEFGIALTYMDVRLLVLEIGAAVKDKPDPEEAKPKPPPPLPLNLRRLRLLRFPRPLILSVSAYWLPFPLSAPARLSSASAQPTT